MHIGFNYDNYSTFRVIDRFLSPRGNLKTLEDARIFAAGVPGSTIEGFNYVEGIWIKFS